MVPLIVLIFSYLVFRLSGPVIPYFTHWQYALRAALGVMFLFTASAHWGKLRPDLIRMVPSAFGNAGTWVTLTGIAEILIAAGLQLRPIATAVAAAAVILLICLLPANIKAAHERLTIGDRPVPGIGVRIAIQVIFLTALVISVWPR